MFVPQLNPVLAGLSALNAAEQSPGVSSTPTASVGPVIGFAEVLGSAFSSLGQGLTTGSGIMPEGTPLAQHSDVMKRHVAATPNGLAANGSFVAMQTQNSALVSAPNVHLLLGSGQQSDVLTTQPSLLSTLPTDELLGPQPVTSVGNLEFDTTQHLSGKPPAATTNVENPTALQTPQYSQIPQPEGAMVSHGLNSATTTNIASPSNSAHTAGAGITSGSAQTNAKLETAVTPDAKAINNSGQQTLLNDDSGQQQDRPLSKQVSELQVNLQERVPQKGLGLKNVGQILQGSSPLPASSAEAFNADKLAQLNAVAAKTMGQVGEEKIGQNLSQQLEQKPAVSQHVFAANPVATTANEALMGQHMGAIGSSISTGAKVATTPGLHAATATGVPISDIAVHMAHNKSAGTNQFTIRLSPESMGTITVKLNISKGAGISGVLQVEKPETLALLQKDVAQLEKALKSQGLNAKDGSFTLVLKSPGNIAKAAEGLGNLAAGAAGSSAETQSNTTNQSSAGQNSSGQNSAGQNANNQPVNAQNASASHQSNASNGFEKSLGNASLTGDEQSFQQSSREHAGDRQSQMQSSLHQGQQDQPNADPDAEQQDYNDNEIPDIILSAYAARNMHMNMSARLDLSI